MFSIAISRCTIHAEFGMSENLYDKASRYLVKLDPAGFFHWLLGLPPHEFTFHDWCDTRAIVKPGEGDRTADMVAHLLNCMDADASWAVLLEFQIEPDPDMFGRLMHHLGLIWQ